MVCKAYFEPCNSCDKLKVFYKDEMYQWRKVVCCPEHFLYHVPIIEYSRGQLSKEQAKAELLETIKNNGNIDFNDNVKSIVAEILSDDKATDKTTKSKFKKSKK